MSSWQPDSWQQRQQVQCVNYPDQKQVTCILDKLNHATPLVSVTDINSLTSQLAQAAKGKRFLLQGGDCAERFIDCHRDGITNNVSRWKKSIYKGTACGAWIALVDNETVQIGSIVEGIEQCAESVNLTWPFTSDDFWAAVQDIEDQCSELWNKTHGCDDCPENPEDGYNMIDPNCPTCKGKGTII